MRWWLFSLPCFVFSVSSGLLALLFLWFWSWKAQLLRIERLLFCLAATSFVFISLRSSWPFSDPASSGNKKVNIILLSLLCFFFPLLVLFISYRSTFRASAAVDLVGFCYKTLIDYVFWVWSLLDEGSLKLPIFSIFTYFKGSFLVCLVCNIR